MYSDLYASAYVSIRQHTDLGECGDLRHNAHTQTNTRARSYTHTRTLSGNSTTLESRCGSSYILLRKKCVQECECMREWVWVWVWVRECKSRKFLLGFSKIVKRVEKETLHSRRQGTSALVPL